MVIKEHRVELQSAPNDCEPSYLLPVEGINPLAQLLLYQLKLGARTGRAHCADAVSCLRFLLSRGDGVVLTQLDTQVLRRL